MDAKRLDLEAIKAREQAATPGPWKFNKYTDASELIAGDGMLVMWVNMQEALSFSLREDRRFLENARQDIPALIEALEAERRENERLLPYKEAAEAYIANCSIDAFRHLQMVVHKNRQGHTKGEEVHDGR